MQRLIFEVGTYFLKEFCTISENESARGKLCVNSIDVGFLYGTKIRKSPEKLTFKQLSDGRNRCRRAPRVLIGRGIAEWWEFLCAWHFWPSYRTAGCLPSCSWSHLPLEKSHCGSRMKKAPTSQDLALGSYVFFLFHTAAFWFYKNTRRNWACHWSVHS